jgi:Domain of unknown function (DUF4386)
MRYIEMSQRRAAIIAGIAYAVMAALSFCANFFALEALVEPGDATATVSNIAGSEGLFRGGVGAFAAVFALDVVIAWALYVFFKRANRGLSLLAAWFRVVTAAIPATALMSLLVVPRLVDGTGYASALPPGQRDAQVMLFLDAYDKGWAIALAFFGVYNILLGFMALRSDYVPNILGILVALAGCGYLLDNFALIVWTGYEDNGGFLEAISTVLAIVGELSLTVWLLLWGGEKEASEAAGVHA